MEDERNLITPLEDCSAKASPARGVSEQPCLGEERSVSPVNEHSATGRLNFAQEVPEEPLQPTMGRVGSFENVMGSRRVSLAPSVTDNLQSVRMAEELRFQLELKRLEIEAANEARRLEIEAANEERRLETEERREARRLEVEERNEARRIDLEVRRLEVEKHRDFEWERSRCGANSTHKGGEREENTVESQMVRSLQLIPDFDEQKVAEWFRRFEKKATEFG